MQMTSSSHVSHRNTLVLIGLAMFIRSSTASASAANTQRVFVRKHVRTIPIKGGGLS